MDAVGPGRMARIGHDGASTGRFDSSGDRAVAAGDNDGSDFSGYSTTPDMHDHWYAGDFGQRFARETRRGEPGGD